jgi:hypothetical protein
MVARIWGAEATAEGCEAYRRHFSAVVLAELRRIDGFQGAYVLMGGGRIQAISLWES